MADLDAFCAIPPSTLCTITTNAHKSLVDTITEFIRKPIRFGSTEKIQFVFEGDVILATFEVITGQHVLFSKHNTVCGHPRHRIFLLELDLENHSACITQRVWDKKTYTLLTEEMESTKFE